MDSFLRIGGKLLCTRSVGGRIHVDRSTVTRDLNANSRTQQNLVELLANQHDQSLGFDCTRNCLRIRDKVHYENMSMLYTAIFHGCKKIKK